MGEEIGASWGIPSNRTRGGMIRSSAWEWPRKAQKRGLETRPEPAQLLRLRLKVLSYRRAYRRACAERHALHLKFMGVDLGDRDETIVVTGEITAGAITIGEVLRAHSDPQCPGLVTAADVVHGPDSIKLACGWNNEA